MEEDTSLMASTRRMLAQLDVLFIQLEKLESTPAVINVEGSAIHLREDSNQQRLDKLTRELLLSEIASLRMDIAEEIQKKFECALAANAEEAHAAS